MPNAVSGHTASLTFVNQVDVPIIDSRGLKSYGLSASPWAPVVVLTTFQPSPFNFKALPVFMAGVLGSQLGWVNVN